MEVFTELRKKILFHVRELFFPFSNNLTFSYSPLYCLEMLIKIQFIVLYFWFTRLVQVLKLSYPFKINTLIYCNSWFTHSQTPNHTVAAIFKPLVWCKSRQIPLAQTGYDTSCLAVNVLHKSEAALRVSSWILQCNQCRIYQKQLSISASKPKRLEGYLNVTSWVDSQLFFPLILVVNMAAQRLYSPIDQYFTIRETRKWLLWLLWLELIPQH